MSEGQTRKARVWLKPEQVKQLRTAINEISPYPLRDKSLLQTLYDTGLRIGEAVQLEVGMLRLDEADPVIGLPGPLQKAYPNDHPPGYTTIELSDKTVRSFTRVRVHARRRFGRPSLGEL